MLLAIKQGIMKFIIYLNTLGTMDDETWNSCSSSMYDNVGKESNPSLRCTAVGDLYFHIIFVCRLKGGKIPSISRK